MHFLYQHGILGGTFDQFHRGHQKLLADAFTKSEQVTIGITTSSLYQHKVLVEQIEDYQTRKRSVMHYLTEKKWIKRATIISIDTIYGNTLEKRNIDAIFATYANLPTVRLINQKRKTLGLPLLTVVVVPTVKGDDNRVITSQRI